MNRNFWISRIWCFLLFQCFCVFALMGNEDEQFKQRVNLALRQAGHHLLLEENDPTTSIAPIGYEGKDGFVLRIDCAFDYDVLPAIVQTAFEDYEITRPYHVLIRNCGTGVPFLGYNKGALRIGDIPCVGREQKETCANILVQFREPTKEIQNSRAGMSSWAWLLLPILGLVFFFFFKDKKEIPVEKKVNDQLVLGGYFFDPKNQLLSYGEEKFNLTFRENKLLHFFAKQPNQVLNRTDILAAVWEEEGVIVGRSLDVFISRLRKLLKQDPNVKIANIHGVGYRLELA